MNIQTPIPSGNDPAFFSPAVPVETSMWRETARNEVQRLQPPKARSNYKLMFVERDPTIPEKLFESLVGAKVVTSQVAMHLERKWRDAFFAKLDRIHDADEWDPKDVPLVAASVHTFLRAMFAWKPKHNPAIGLSGRGNMIAAWRDGEIRLTVEFYPDDKVGWIVSLPRDGWTQKCSTSNLIDEFENVLSPYTPVRWFKFGEVRRPAS
jgi:hypothetical protein